MIYLFIVAHPDDEVLGAGATIYKLAKEGHTIIVGILSGEVDARRNRPQIKELYRDIIQCGRIIGIKRFILGKFPNIAFNTVSHLKLVKFIEKIIINEKPDVIFTHHPADLNNDHYATSIACQAAIRLFQRRTDLPPIKEFLYMEILSSTEWALNTALKSFQPNTFVEVGEIGIKKKIEALSEYIGVMREYPHPRSKEAMRGLATYRGCQAGMCYAESFETVFRREI